MDQPTKEEDNLLISMLLEAARKEISDDIRKNWTSILTPQANIESLAAIMAHKEVTRTEHRIKNELRDKPLDDMPLYVNDPDIFVRITAVWRMKIGK